ncbi:MAG: type II toxin-antitoxin system RelB/DinJ family antitoxin [Defluviitaleaceae bacterium]|nr:type II toxin-antitoxin system RelB/DinJ family antitoxin [Defluviitaleaceae bacterium]
METITINIESDLKNKAQHIFDALGLDMSTAINMLLRKTIQDALVSVQKKDRRAAFGCLKGKINVPDDFNEPLDDFKEYM